MTRPRSPGAQSTASSQSAQRYEPRTRQPHPRQLPAVALIEPTTFGYIHLAAQVAPRLMPRDAGTPGGPERSKLMATLKHLGHRTLPRSHYPQRDVFDAVATPPASRFSPYLNQLGEPLHLARFDVVVLIETTSPAAAIQAQASPAYQAITDTLRQRATHGHVVVARNAERFGNLDKTNQGLFLFNYLIADDTNVMLELWDQLSAWYTTEMGLDNSTLLVPLDGQHSDYLAINAARVKGTPQQFLDHQQSNKTFDTYVLANLEANRVGAMPVLYQLA